MTIKVKSELECSFKKECRIINLRKEYPNYLGIAKWAIASSLPEVELRAKYAALVKPYEPFVYLTADQYLPIVHFHNADRNYLRQYVAHMDAYGYQDDLFERFHPELIVNVLEGKPNWTRLYIAIEQLNPAQRVRIKKRYFDSLSYEEIALQENVSPQAVQQSVARALATMKKYLEAIKFDPFDDPVWE